MYLGSDQQNGTNLEKICQTGMDSLERAQGLRSPSKEANVTKLREIYAIYKCVSNDCMASGNEYRDIYLRHQNGLRQSTSSVIILGTSNHSLKYSKGFEQNLFHCPVNTSVFQQPEIKNCRGKYGAHRKSEVQQTKSL